LLVIPLVVIFQDGLSEGLAGLWHAISLPIAWSALKLTLWTSAVMAGINAVMGTMTAYVLVRYAFPGKSVLNAIVDLPLAIPTLVTGVMLVVLYGPQSLVGGWLQEQLGWGIIFARPGIVLALLFINYPFVVRAVQPVLENFEQDAEEAAATLGAGSLTIFTGSPCRLCGCPLSAGHCLALPGP
jgi:sulfate transport system permease protein